MIVGISGKINSGKTSMSKQLIALGYRKVSFADWLKETCADVFNFDLAMAYDQDEKEAFRLLHWDESAVTTMTESIYSSISAEENLDYNEVYIAVAEFSRLYVDFTSIRECLQLVGTELIRNKIDPDYHVKVTLDHIDESEKIVIDDVRFPNEVAGLLKYGGMVFRIDRQLPEHEGVTHESEIALDNWTEWTEVIDSNCDYEAYCANVQSVIERYNLANVEMEA